MSEHSTAAEAQELIERYLEAVPLRDEAGGDPREMEAGRAILSASGELRIAVLELGLQHLGELGSGCEEYSSWQWSQARWNSRKPTAEQQARHHQWLRRQELHALLAAILERQLPCTWEDVRRILRASVRTEPRPFRGECGPLPGFVPMLTKQIQKHGAGQPLDPEVREWLTSLREELQAFHWWGGFKKSLASIDEVLSAVEEGMPEAGEAWADAVLRDMGAMPAEARAQWKALLKHAPVAQKHQPSAKWLEQAAKLIAPVETELDGRLAAWLHCVGRGATAPASDRNADFLKGLCWYAGLRPSAEVGRALAAAVEGCLRKTQGGLYCSRAVKSALWALERMPADEAIAQLVRLKLRIKSPWGLEQVQEPLDRLMEQAGLTPDEVEELSVPDYGLVDGALVEELDGCHAELRITGSASAELAWFDAAGKALKGAPASATKSNPDRVKALKRAVTDIEKMLAAQRSRLDRLFLAPRAWTVEQWKQRYVEHPLLAGLAGRLIWSFKTGERVVSGIRHEGALRSRDGSEIELSSETDVRLWHPLAAAAEEVLGWRVWLEEHEVTQPFKQAHREVYLLTDAERATASYSNRFAGHILRQHQAAALAAERGWEFAYLGAWDSGEVGASLKLPRWELEVRFHTGAAGGGEETAESGVCLYVSTDRVEFRNLGAAPRPLEEVPALVFSEVMRDVDLFVGVSSIGNDPEWRDRGTGEVQAYDDYWQHYSFGELSVSAAMRREVLERLLSRLSIAGRCTLEERFLKVRGELRTYKIHLRSGNILMEPDDHYLCIVPGRAEGPQNLFLPFEGDRMLAVILSKAFLLADDRKIKDESIRRQIGPR